MAMTAVYFSRGWDGKRDEPFESKHMRTKEAIEALPSDGPNEVIFDMVRYVETAEIGDDGVWRPVLTDKI